MVMIAITCMVSRAARYGSMDIEHSQLYYFL